MKHIIILFTVFLLRHRRPKQLIKKMLYSNKLFKDVDRRLWMNKVENKNADCGNYIS
jgi:hypothetical protein